MRLDCVGKERAGYGEGTILKKTWVSNRCSFIAIVFLMGKKLKVFLFCREEANEEKRKPRTTRQDVKSGAAQTNVGRGEIPACLFPEKH